MLRRQRERLRRFSFYGFGSLEGAAVIAEQVIHRLRKVHVVKPSDKVHGIAADLLVLVVPQISSNSYFIRTIAPDIFLAGTLELFALTAQQGYKIGLPGDLFLFGCEMNVFGWHRISFQIF